MVSPLYRSQFTEEEEEGIHIGGQGVSRRVGCGGRKCWFRCVYLKEKNERNQLVI
jgi:hypothetical protein